jgi:peptidase M1-like protein
MRSLGLAASLAVALGAAAVEAAPLPTPGAVLDAVDGAFRARDATRYLALWDFETAEAKASEAEFFNEAAASPANQLVLRRPGPVSDQADHVNVSAQVVFIAEPRARVEQWALVLRRGPSGWTIRERQTAGRIDGLVHLSLDPAGYRAAGLTLRFEDFELAMARGTLFTAPESLGPTVLVFVGDGTVRVTPRPETEREQLRQFCGHTELVTRVDRVFVRLHPADLAAALSPMRLEPDRESALRWEAAQRFYKLHSERTFVLDGSLPGSPWSVMPAPGDSLVAFDAGSRGMLTFTINSALPESVSLFDRARRIQVCLYPSGGREATYSEDDGREVDILSHDLRARFDPRQRTLQGQDTLRLRLLNGMSTLRLRLDDALAVESVTSAEAGAHLFFRVRGQNSLMVALGPLGVAAGEIALTIRYAGAFSPEPVDSEILQTSGRPGSLSSAPPGLTDDAIWIEKVEVFSNRNAWYPQTSAEDYALATLHLETPAGFAAVAGGERASAVTEGDRTVTEFRQDRPARYLSVAVGRLVAAGSRVEGNVSVNAFAVSRERDLVAQELDRAGDILRFYSREFGPCPYPAVSLVLIQGQVPGGHSPAGMVILARKPSLIHREFRDDPTDFSDVPGFFLAHELAHQWWGQGVGPKNYRERWLSEGAAQYAAALWVRQAHGEDAFQAVLKRMARWASRESPNGPIHLGYRLGHVKGNPEIFRAIVYDKGAYVLHMLRGIVGEDSFRRAMTKFLESHRFEKVGTDDLQSALEAESGLDLAPYFRQWIFGTALPRLRYSYKTARAGATLRTTIEVSAENVPGPIPLELGVTHQIGRAVLHVMLPPQGGRYSVDTPTEPRKVEINADRGVLASTGS